MILERIDFTTQRVGSVVRGTSKHDGKPLRIARCPICGKKGALQPEIRELRKGKHERQAWTRVYPGSVTHALEPVGAYYVPTRCDFPTSPEGTALIAMWRLFEGIREAHAAHPDRAELVTRYYAAMLRANDLYALGLAKGMGTFPPSLIETNMVCARDRSVTTLAFLHKLVMDLEARNRGR